MKPGRYRICGCEPCHLCGAVVLQTCRNYKGGGKAPCWLRSICHRCAAQPNECRCGVVRPPGKVAWPIGKRDQEGQRLLFDDRGAGFVVGAQ